MEIDYQFEQNRLVPHIIPEDNEDISKLRDAIQSLVISNPCKKFAADYKKAEEGKPSIIATLREQEIITLATAVNELAEFYKDESGEMAQKINLLKLFEILLTIVTNDVILKQKH